MVIFMNAVNIYRGRIFDKLISPYSNNKNTFISLMAYFPYYAFLHH
jgi:hypothetical protein